ncbi:DUF4349 domain-containing protein [Paraflavitalea sp. CAU 1676]|uniref:DUF4349 domain-containing protein n=1 Tax=Paraflavitalea sp. CAU 1676 TaxID=3032598 RepID=UPI0023D9C14D|nr:DUF4349 domain-containing protein [Paraflavitalea sp. CAU 1676]MDF2190431.1 DUF4349 domain-containing protein [Paraflavitalea sp. CAU 1676]
MKNIFKGRFWNYGKWFVVLFFAMLIFRLAYGYITSSLSQGGDYSSDYFDGVANLRKNYASEKQYLKNDVPADAQNASSQKYEKTASIKSKSAQFEEGVKQINSETSKFGGVVQYEKNTGNKGNREIHLLIGISPDKFDSFYVKIQHIGDVKAKEVTKVDKTNEYRQLNAKKASLEKTLASLNELKAKGGVISDFVALHDKILEIETQLQALGVELGNFDTENEFCTVKFSLYEGATHKGVPFIQRLKVALEWTIDYYAVLMVCLFGAALTVLFLLLILDKLNVMKVLNK